MNTLFESTLNQLNLVKQQSHRYYIALSLARAAAMAAVSSGLWMVVDPSKPLTALALGAFSFAVLAAFTSFKRKHHVEEKALLLGLDVSYPSSSTSPFEAAATDEFAVQDEWQPRLARETKRIKALETRRLTSLLASLLIPSLIALLIWTKSSPSISQAIAEAKEVLSLFTSGTTLQVIAGAVDKKSEDDDHLVELSASRHPVVELLPENMIKIHVRTHSSKSDVVAPNLELRGLEQPGRTSDAIQSFQMTPEFDAEGRQSGWSLEFSAPASSDIVIPRISNSPIAQLKVRSLPIPKVDLSLAAPRQDPWPDNIPLPLNIKVDSYHPLRKIQLKIRLKSRTVSESVTNVMGDQTHVVTTDYKLNLEPFLEEDFMELEIRAEATDQAQPEPLTGTSPPLVLRVASAYGRYKATLETLSKIRTILAESVSENKPPPTHDVIEMTDQALTQADSSPFFDGLDRSELSRITSGVKAYVQSTAANKSNPKLLELSNDLGRFLFEHETLDDRERDRDFFISLRTLSRLLDQPRATRNFSVDVLVARMKTFLSERQERWTRRVGRLGDSYRPSSWPHIRDGKPFHHGLDEAKQIDHDRGSSDPGAAQESLAKVSSQFKAWIEELEAKEDAWRAKQEQERQQGLANARNELREIQQRQDQISSALDKANERPQSEVSAQWSGARPHELSNVKQANSLLGQMRGLSPTAGERLEAAIKSMEETSNAGNKEDFVNAETFSDLAGRLLREAEQSAAQSQQKRDRGRRKRTSGDDYHGQTVVGGDIDIKSEYQVDPRYREQILNDAQESGSTAEDRAILDNYLRQTLR